MASPREKPRVLFVNAGILGLVSLHEFLRVMLPRQSEIAWDQVLLPERLTLSDRLVRRILTQRLWRDGWLGIANLDLARFRAELNTGIHARRRIRELGSDRYDVLHFHRTGAAYASLDLMRRIPSIVSIDCTQDCVIDAAASAVERSTYGLNAWLDGRIFATAAAIVATSHWAARTLRSRYPACETPVHVLADPVMLDRFDPGWADARARRAARGERPRFLFVGGDFPRKGGYELLEAWRAGGLADEAELEIVTDWPLADAPPRGVRLTRGVRRHTPEWERCWREADVFVMPTRNEAFGLVYQEAGAAALPAIGTAHNAIPEIVLHDRTGLLVPVGDRPALVAAMQALARDPMRRQALGTAARRHIEQVASPDAYLAALLAIIRSVTRARALG
ncbi:MAG TPA: glycosyltransferase family 4 protein [Vicinamibacterales bacterium]|nr:glycosyltransferase family 4 protein [Vicinamibacterales bacterium]